MDVVQMGDHHMLDNVFVDPASYKMFLVTGMWPDKTMLVKENRRADTRGSINKSGKYQSTEIMGIEIHIKDTAHFPDQWAFFAFGDGLQPAVMIPPDRHLLFMPRGAWCCRQDICAVLSDFDADREGQGHAVSRLQAR